MSDTDLSHHYRVLKQFLDISDDSNSRAKSNSSRAARAREKLLRLSGAQFRELSTDVYDELRRRIDESRSEPDFLLPKSTFHPKRNQARQKLSSLPQSRFKDLVSDISFEIERRNLHSPVSTSVAQEPQTHSRTQHETVSTPRTPSAGSFHARDPVPVSPKQNRGSVASRDRAMTQKASREDKRQSVQSGSTVDLSNVTSNIANSTSLHDDLATPDLRKQIPEQAIGIQPTTVVPAKASMTWSSDEEENGADYQEVPSSKHEEEPRQVMLSNAFAPPHSDNAPLENTPRSLSANPSSLPADNQDKNLKAAYEKLKQEHDSLISAHSDVQSQMADLAGLHEDATARLAQLTDEHKSAQKDLSDSNEKHLAISSRHAALEELVQSLTRENESLASQQADLPSYEELSSLKSELENLKTSNASLRLENQNLRTSSPKSKNVTSTREIHSQKTGDSKEDVSSIQLNAELKKLHDKLDQIPKGIQDSHASQREAKLKNEISQWQNKFASLKATDRYDAARNPGKSMDLSRFCSPDGLLSLKTAVDLFASIDLFFAALDISNPNADLFFERISSTAILANRIASQASRKGFSDNGHADAIRESANHALTATRYFVVYPTLMPKVIVERAVSEIAFAICDSISSLRFEHTSEKRSSGKLDSSVGAKPVDPSRDEINEKPLRITQRRNFSSDHTENKEQRDNTATPRAQMTDLNQSSTNTPQFSPIQQSAKSQSSPTPSRDLMMNTPSASTTSSELIPDKRSSLKNVFNNMLKSENDEIESKAKSQSIQNSMSEVESNGSIQTAKQSERVTSGSASDDSAINNNFVKAEVETQAKASPKVATPSILEKVRKFEKSAPSQKSLTQQEGARRTNDHNSLSSTEKDENFHTLDGERSVSSSTDGNPTRNKSIFQSLRERFTSDSNAKSATETNGNLAHEDIKLKVEDKEDEAADDDFETVTTPSKAEKFSRPSLAQHSDRDEQLVRSSGSLAETPRRLESDLSKFNGDPREKSSASRLHNDSNSQDISLNTTDDKNRGLFSKSEYSDLLTSSEQKLASPLIGTTGALASDTNSSVSSRKDQMPDDVIVSSSLSAKETNSPANTKHDPRSKSVIVTPGQSAINSPSGNKQDFTPEVPLISRPPKSGKEMDVPKENNKLQVDGTVSSETRSIKQTSSQYPEDTDKLSTKFSESDNTLSKPYHDVKKSEDTISSLSDKNLIPARENSTALSAQQAISDHIPSDVSNQEPDEKVAAKSLQNQRNFDPYLKEESVFPQHLDKSVTSLSNDRDGVLRKEARGFSSPTTSKKENDNLSKSVLSNPSVSKSPIGLKIKSPSFKVRKVNYEDAVEEQDAQDEFEDADDESFDEAEDEIRQRQDYRKSMAAATFNFDLFDIDDPDNTVTQVLLYLEHQTVQVISTIQDLLSAIKKPDATRGELRENSGAISEVIKQMTEATNTSMNQTRNHQLREHGSWVVKSLEDCNHRMTALCKPNTEKDDSEFADRHFKQRLAGISFDIAKCTKELVKTVEEASLKEDIAHLDARLSHPDDLT